MRCSSAPGHMPRRAIAAAAEAAAAQDDRSGRSNVQAYELLGRMYLSQQRLDEALAEFDALSKRHPRPVQAHTLAGVILEAQNKPEDARTALRAGAGDRSGDAGCGQQPRVDVRRKRREPGRRAAARANGDPASPGQPGDAGHARLDLLQEGPGQARRSAVRAKRQAGTAATRSSTTTWGWPT